MSNEIVHRVYCWRGGNLVERFVVPDRIMRRLLRRRVVRTDWVYRGEPVVIYLSLPTRRAEMIARLCSVRLVGDSWTLEGTESST